MTAGHNFTGDYYEELQARVRAILISVGSSISPRELSLFNDLVDANEPGVVIDMLTETLADSNAEVSQTDFEDIKAVAEKMKLDPAIVDRLRPQAEP